MNAVYHPEFPKDIRRYRARYEAVSVRLGSRFANEIDRGIERIKSSPSSVGNFVNTGSTIIKEFRRVTLPDFPFFILYAIHADEIIIGSLIPTASDPLTWLTRFRK